MAEYPKPVGTDSFTDGKVGGTTLVGGDIILYDVGSHTGTQFFKDFHGESEENPIIIDVNGQSVDAQSENKALSLRDCSHIKIINGTFFGSSTQGVYCAESWGVSIDSVTSHSHVGTAFRVGYQSVVDEPTLQRANFTDPYALINNCTAYNITGSGEGAYMGASNPHWYKVNTDGTVFQYAKLAKGRITNSTFYNIGFDAIQMGSCEDGIISGNEVYNYGTLADASDMNGIQLGQGSSTLCYNNYIHDYGAGSTGYGIFVQGDSNIVFNNIIDNAYNGINAGSGSYAGSNAELLILNNTITRIQGEYGIRINTRFLRTTNIQNNLIHFDIQPNGSTTFYTDVVYSSTNYILDNYLHTYEGENSMISLFTDYANDDFSLKAGSAAIGGGISVSLFNSMLMNNYIDELRPITGSIDIGAY